jgi:raffinose/stachyose/melibiose transport system substrate-binding protein
MLFGNTAKSGLDPVIANFQRQYPDIKVQVQYVDAGNILATLQPALRAGNAPDLFQMQPGNPTSPDVLAAAGSLLDLSGSPWAANLYRPTKPWLVVEGKTYAWPLALNPQGMVFNRTLFDELHLSIPTTFAELTQLCPKITAAGKVAIANGFAGQQVSGIVVGEMVGSAFVYGRDPAWDEKRTSGKVTFSNSPLWRDALKAVISLRSAGCLGRAAGGVSLTEGMAAFAGGNAAMALLATPQFPQFLQINPNVKYGFFSLPGANAGDAVASQALSLTVGGYSQTKHPKEVRLLIDFLAKPDQNKVFADAGGGLSTFDAEKGNLPKFMESSMVTQYRAGKVGFWPRHWPNPNMHLGPSGLAQGINGLITGQLTVDDVLRKLDYLFDNPKAADAS